VNKFPFDQGLYLTILYSLLPADMHANIAKICIASKTPMVTASYIGADMQLLDEAYVDAE